jgi:hypothetical protein
MEMDYSKFKEAASGGSKTPETTGDGLSDLESALDQIQRAKQMERRLQDEVGPSLSDQVLKLAQDPKIQRAAREIWYGPEEAATAGPSGSTNGASDGPVGTEVTPEVTPEVTNSEEPGVTSGVIEPVQSDLTAVDDYVKVDRITAGRDVLELGIATTDTGSQRVTITDGDEVIQYRAEEFIEWVEREGLYDPSDEMEKRLQKLREWVNDASSTKKDEVLLTLIMHEYHGESSVFDTQEDIADFLDTSNTYVRNVKSEFSGSVTLNEDIEVTL